VTILDVALPALIRNYAGNINACCLNPQKRKKFPAPIIKELFKSEKEFALL